jgi:hypothetical protein
VEENVASMTSVIYFANNSDKDSDGGMDDDDIDGYLMHYHHVESLLFPEKMVAWDGIEPPTRGFSVLCSTD